VLPVEESIPNSALEMLRMGADVMVLEPLELRREVARLTAEIATLYKSPPEVTTRGAVAERHTPRV
jgi:hypothetical protein